MTTTAGLPTLLKPREAAAILRTTESAMRTDRFYNRGCPYIKVGARVLYDADVVREYLAARVVTTHPIDMPTRD